MTDLALRIIYRLTGSQRASEAIWTRTMDRRWKERVAAHKAAGGAVITTEIDGCVSQVLA